jgi:hypothetical protein
MRSPRFLATLVVLVVGCTKPPTPEELAEQTASDLDAFWQEALATARITNVMKVRDEFWTNIEGLQRNPPSSRPVIPDSSFSNDLVADAKVLTKRVFTSANVTQQGTSSISFRVTGTDLCTPLRGGVTADTRCVTQIDKLKLAIRVSGINGGYQMELLVNDTLPVGTVQIVKGVSVAATADLANARPAAEFINSTLGMDSPFSGTTMDGAGTVEGKLFKHGPSDFEVTVTFSTDLSGTLTDNRGVTRSAKSAARNPVFALRIDGQNKHITSTIDIGSSEYRAVWSDFFYSNPQLTTPMIWALSGGTLKADLKDDGPRSFTGIGVGQGANTLSFGNDVVASVTLNPSSQNRFDLDFGSGSSGLYAVTVRPGIAFNLSFNFQVVANAGMTGIDQNLLSSSFLYELSSSDQAPKFELNRPATNIDASVKLANGTVTLSGNGSPRAFSAVSCMAFRNYLSSGMNPFLDIWMRCEECMSNQCGGPAICGPTNCAGCCSGNVCYSGINNSQCGSSGLACVDCTATASLCNASRQCM